MNSLKLEIADQIKKIVRKQFPQAKIYLYGSRARGKAGEHSDWDLLILLNSEKIPPETEQAISYPLYDLGFDTGEVISPLIFSEREWNVKYKVTPFYQNVMRDAIKL
jgi:predicted nucleotidyltransferase